MDKNQIGGLLSVAKITADQIAAMEGVKGVPAKTPIVGTLIQNLHESLLALDKGVDVEGTAISPGEIGEGLEKMLEFMSVQSHWARLQEGLSKKDAKTVNKLSDQIHSAANALTSPEVRTKTVRDLPPMRQEPVSSAREQPQIPAVGERNYTKQILAAVLIFFGTLLGYIVIYAFLLDAGTPGVKHDYLFSAILTAVSGGLIVAGIRLARKGYGNMAMSLFVLVVVHLIINLKGLRHYSTYRKDLLEEEIASLLSGPDLWVPACAVILAVGLFIFQRKKKLVAATPAGSLRSRLKNSKVSDKNIGEPAGRREKKLAATPAVPSNSEIENSKVSEEKINNPLEMIKILEEADEYLYQSNNPDDEVNLAKRLMASPEDAIRAIENRGWKKRGKAEETNRFLIRILSRILNEGEETLKEKALEALVKMFATPDDNTTGWVSMLEQSAGVIANSKMPEAKEKLESLRSKISGKNLEAIDYALNLLKSS